MAAKKQSYTLQDVDITLAGNIVGGAQSVSVSIEFDNKPIFEGGSKFAREILPGQGTVSGTVERLFLDSETIKELVDLKEGNHPYFNIVGVTKNKDPERRITVIDAMFKGFSIDLSLTDETKISQDFDALRVDLN
jgi:hypothetical protein